jgi:hypothetical protein
MMDRLVGVLFQMQFRWTKSQSNGNTPEMDDDGLGVTR